MTAENENIENVRPRNIKNVQGIVVHQTACDFEPSPDLVKRFNGDYDAAKHQRAMRVKAHVVALKCGHFVTPYGVDEQRGSLDRRFCNIEVEGSFKSTDQDQMSDKLLAASKNGLRYLMREIRAKGGSVEYLYAHRQFNQNRTNDPGPEIWTKLVNGYGVRSLGMKTRLGYVSGSGKTVPESWNKMPAGLLAGLGIGGALVGVGLFVALWHVYKRLKRR